ncbi:MAG: alkaline phosphatase family protein [Nitrospinota bacterium]
MKTILIILDGLGDRPQQELDNKTPLEYAKTPNLDKIAGMGINGLYHPLSLGICPSSEIAHFRIFGYDLYDFPGRGIIEASGEGIPFDNNDVLCLAHFADVEERNGHLYLKRDRSSLTHEECKRLTSLVGNFQFNGICLRFHHTRKTEGILVLTGDVSHEITDSDPMFEGLPIIKVQPYENAGDRQRAETTSEALNRYIRWVYNHIDGKAGRVTIITQRPGRKKSILPFDKKYGMKGLSIASSPLYWGLAREIGLSCKKVKDSDSADRDLRERLIIARDSLSEFDFIHVHTKRTDTAAHTRMPVNKVRTIEDIDRAMGFALDEFIDRDDIIMIVGSDHSTPSSGALIHSGEPVPVVICGNGIRVDDVDAFGERPVSKGGLGHIYGSDIMNMILNITDRGKLAGLMSTPIDLPYYPGDIEPFEL